MQQVYNHKVFLTINEHKISSNALIIVYTKYRDHVKPSHHTKTSHDFKLLYKMACPFNFFVLQFPKKDKSITSIVFLLAFAQYNTNETKILYTFLIALNFFITNIF